MQNIAINDGHIIIQAAYTDLATCRSLPGRRWDAARRVWLVPATPAAARAVLTAFPQAAGRAALEELTKRLGDYVVPCEIKTRRPAWEHQKRAFWRMAKIFGDVDNSDGQHAPRPRKKGGAKCRIPEAQDTI